MAEDFPPVRRDDRAFFLDHVWDYQPGEHVTILGPTGSGKTHLAQELLERSATPEMPAVMLVLKPKDPLVERWAKKVAFKKVTVWPQPPSPWRTSPPPGYVLWPRHAFRVAQDRENHLRVFETAIMDSYRKGNRIVFADEVSGLQRLGLTDELETVWERGRSQPCGLWAATQRPTHISSHAYVEPTHIFVSYVGDKRAQERLAEISGVDYKLVRHTVANLGHWEWLYIHRPTRRMCIILP